MSSASTWKRLPSSATPPIKSNSPATARGIASLPQSVTDQLKELTNQGKRHGGVHAASGTLVSKSRDKSARMALLGIVFNSVGLPEQYPVARFVMWLKHENIYDTVRGFVAVARSPRSIGEVINLGSGFEVTIRRAGELIAEEMGTTIQYREDEQRLRPALSEVERLLCANAKAQRLLGWAPAIAGEAGLRAGLRATIAWFLDPANRARYDASVYGI